MLNSMSRALTHHPLIFLTIDLTHRRVNELAESIEYVLLLENRIRMWNRLSPCPPQSLNTEQGEREGTDQMDYLLTFPEMVSLYSHMSIYMTYLFLNVLTCTVM